MWLFLAAVRWHVESGKVVVDLVLRADTRVFWDSPISHPFVAVGRKHRKHVLPLDLLLRSVDWIIYFAARAISLILIETAIV